MDVIDKMDKNWRELAAMHRAKSSEVDRLRGALHSIAMNTCCDTCQEAALVAQRALLKNRK